jgi:hypothetical protein
MRLLSKGAPAETMDSRPQGAENDYGVRTVEQAIGQRGAGVVTRYWVIGLIAVIVAAIFLARRMSRAPESSKQVDLPLWEEDPHGPAAIKADEVEDDTTPAVLSPSEWKAPKSAFNSSRR